MNVQDDNYWMSIAIAKAKEGDSPFGALLVNKEGQFVTAYNTTNTDGVTAHAEMNVIDRIEELTYDNPEDLLLYTTVEPCTMCMGSIIWAGVGCVKFGASIEEVSAFTKQIMVSAQELAEKSWRKIIVQGAIQREDCLRLWKQVY